jgi:hypothetical protein
MRWLVLAVLGSLALGCGGLVDGSGAPLGADGGADATTDRAPVLRTPVFPPRHTLDASTAAQPNAGCDGCAHVADH